MHGETEKKNNLVVFDGIVKIFFLNTNRLIQKGGIVFQSA
jgi:hypothetical protein